MLKQLVIFLIALTFCGSFLVGCGRKGALEPPPSTMIENERGDKQMRPKQDKPFILDRFIMGTGEKS